MRPVFGKISRRRILAGAGASAALLPFVPVLDARSKGGEFPRRVIFFFSSNGTVREAWLPQMQEGELVLGPVLAPLEGHKSRLLVVDGLRYGAALDKGETDGHYAGMNTALTGAVPRLIAQNDPDNLSLPDGLSVDQHIGAAVGRGLKFATLELGIQIEAYAATIAALSFAGPMQPILADDDPYHAFERIFTGLRPGGMVDPAVAQRIARRRSVIDFVAKDLGRVRMRLAAIERIKVDAHLDALRDIEDALATGAGGAATENCTVPDTGRAFDPHANDMIPAVSRLQIDLMVMAMACDLTRVGTIQYGRGGAQHRFSWLGPDFNADPDNGPNDSTSGLHGLAHNEGVPESRAKLTQCHAWYAGELAYLLDRLGGVPEGDGSMLDHTIVVWMNELGEGGNHTLEETPWVIAGNVDGYFDSGRLVAFPGVAHNGLLASLCQAMGLPDTEFGDADFHQGPLAGLT